MSKPNRPQITRLEDYSGYMVEGFDDPFPSVTNIIKATVPKELAWWGMQVGVEGALYIVRNSERPKHSWTMEEIVVRMGQNRLTTNDVMKQAGARGTELHDILEAYGKTGNLPEVISDGAVGYAKALGKFLLENRPEFYVQEIATASPTYRYAGTFDGKCIFQNGKLQGKKCLIDLKTAKRVYKDQYHPQLEAYEHAEVELGEEPTEDRVVVRIAEDGKYQLSVSRDTFEDFHVLLKHYESIQRRKQKKRK